ncbi:hypothetical protein Tco_0309938 [Tanacetum coccineum]
MDSDKYLEGQSMQRPPLFESGSFIYWRNKFETYVKSKNLDLWHVITDGDFQPIIQNPETKLDEVVPFEKQTDDLKRRLAKNNEAKMVLSCLSFNTIITSLKALDEGYSGKNYVSADNRPPMLEKDMYDSWKSIMELYMMNRQHGRMILESVENGLLIWPSIEENRVSRPKKYSELSATEAIQADCDIKATNIILQ